MNACFFVPQNRLREGRRENSRRRTKGYSSPSVAWCCAFGWGEEPRAMKELIGEPAVTLPEKAGDHWLERPLLVMQYNKRPYSHVACTLFWGFELSQLRFLSLKLLLLLLSWLQLATEKFPSRIFTQILQTNHFPLFSLVCTDFFILWKINR